MIDDDPNPPQWKMTDEEKRQRGILQDERNKRVAEENKDAEKRRIQELDHLHVQKDLQEGITKPLREILAELKEMKKHLKEIENQVRYLPK